MPVAIDLGVILAAVLALIVAYGFLFVYRGTFKPLLLALANIFGGIGIPLIYRTVHPFGFLAAWLKDAATAIDHALARLVLDVEGGVVTLWHGLAKQAEWLGKLLGDFAETVEARFRGFTLGTIPRQLSNLRRQLAHSLAVAAAATVAAEASFRAKLDRLGRGIDRTLGNLRHALLGAVAALSARVGTLSGTVHGIEHGIGDLWRRLTHTGSRLGRLEKLLSAAGAAALVGAALARLGLGWLRCPRVAKAGKQVCGMDADLLESLLADTLLIAGTISLVEFAEGMQTIVGDAADAARYLWRA